MTGQHTDLQESMNPESRADLDHRTLPAIQPADQTHDLQTGDVGAVLQRNRTLHDPWITNVHLVEFVFLRECMWCMWGSPGFYRCNSERQRRLVCGGERGRWCSSRNPVIQACPGQRKPETEGERIDYEFNIWSKNKTFFFLQTGDDEAETKEVAPLFIILCFF